MEKLMFRSFKIKCTYIDEKIMSKTQWYINIC